MASDPRERASVSRLLRAALETKLQPGSAASFDNGARAAARRQSDAGTAGGRASRRLGALAQSVVPDLPRCAFLENVAMGRVLRAIDAPTLGRVPMLPIRADFEDAAIGPVVTTVTARAGVHAAGAIIGELDRVWIETTAVASIGVTATDGRQGSRGTGGAQRTRLRAVVRVGDARQALKGGSAVAVRRAGGSFLHTGVRPSIVRDRVGRTATRGTRTAASNAGRCEGHDQKG
jgi:hypothetical protein